jgi:acetylornithine deacetylase
MNVFELTRALVDIESVTGAEKRVGDFLFEYLERLARTSGGTVERMPIEGQPERFNVLASWGEPLVTLSTHMDTVPPYFASREDQEFIWGRGACDAKGIAASMIVASEKLLGSGVRDFGVLLVAGEERDGIGAHQAAKQPRGSRFLINGEPTESKIALGSKGSLRFEIIARGKLAHSAYPELGESAIDKLLDVLSEIRGIELPQDELLGHSTLNIGTLTGGRAGNVIADYAAAEILFRLVRDAEPLRAAVKRAAAGRAEPREIVATAAQRLEAFEGLESMVAAFTTDIPVFAGTWGKPFLIGPGSIHVAHTAEERIAKKELQEAVEIYSRMVKTLVAQARRGTN